MGIGWCWGPMVTSRCHQEGETSGYLVVEVRHGLLTTTRQSSCKVGSTPDVAHFVVRIVELGIRVVRPLGRTGVVMHKVTVINPCYSFA